MTNRNAIILMLLISAATSGAFYAYWLTINTPEGIAQRRADAARDKAERDARDNIERAQAVIRASLKDPDSAKIADVRVATTGIVCGLVNAKNSYGGYTGNHRWAFDHGLTAIERDDEYYNKAMRGISKYFAVCWPN